MKRILALLLTLVAALSSLVACANDSDYESVEYRENGIYFILPNTMRRKTVENYEFYFTSEIMGVVFSAKKITREFLSENNIDPEIDAKGYVDTIIEKQSFERDKIYYNYYEDFNQHNFRYNYSEGDSEVFFYVTVTGETGNLWYVEMYCYNDDSSEYLSMFERWRKTIGTY